MVSRLIRVNGLVLLCALIVWHQFASVAYAQFTTILNIPPDPDIGDNQSIDSNTQLNLSDGGAIGSQFRAGASNGSSSNIEVNITGGTVGERFAAGGGSTVNVSGGTIGDTFVAQSGSTVNISGGMFNNVTTLSGSEVNISGGTFGNPFGVVNGTTLRFSGGNFRLDGQLISGLETVGNTLPLIVPIGSVLSGTFQDGTPFAFTSQESDFLTRYRKSVRYFVEPLTLEAATLPPESTSVTTLPGDIAPLGVRSGQTLRVNDGGNLNANFNAGRGSTVIIAGGEVGSNFEAVGAQVNISGGTVGKYFDAFGGSIVNISGGTVDRNFEAFGGSTVNISGGSTGRSFNAYSGSTVNISGGTVDRISFRSGSRAHLSGGTFDVNVNEGSAIRLSGGEFRLDGQLISGLETVGNTRPIKVPLGSVLSGTLQDGTPFAFSSYDSERIPDGTLTLEAAALSPKGPSIVTLPGDPSPMSIRSGQTLRVDDGGTVGASFNAGRGSTVNVTGGEVGYNFEAVGAQVNISGGTVGNSFDAMDGSIVNISGGRVGSHFDAIGGSTVNISGGLVSFAFDAFDGSTVNLSGGRIGGYFKAREGSTVNIFGEKFVLQGRDITDSLEPGVPFTISTRGGILEGILADGSPFSFELRSGNYSFKDQFDDDALLTVTLGSHVVPEPNTLLLGLLAWTLIAGRRVGFSSARLG